MLVMFGVVVEMSEFALLSGGGALSWSGLTDSPMLLLVV